MNFQDAHVIKNPAGTYSVVGLVPATCLEFYCDFTRADALAGRVKKVGGVYQAYREKTFTTALEARTAVISGGVTLCSCCEGSRQ